MKHVLTLIMLGMQLSLAASPTTLHKEMELPLVVVVCSYNNARWVDKNLDSIFMQDYTNYRVIYVDDASPDGTAKAVAAYQDTCTQKDKLTLIANKERSRKTKNVYNVFHSCKDNEIIVIVDGDDWLAHDQVFKQINQTYLTHDIWLTWGQFYMTEKRARGWAQAVPQELIDTNNFREFTWVYGAPRTFYAWLFKQIKIEDFIGLNIIGFEGKFYPSADDFAMMYPMLEMAHDRIRFIPEIAYIVNQYNPLSTSHAKPADPIISMQSACEVKMYKMRYDQLTKPIMDVEKKLERSKADIILLSSTPEKTSALITSIQNQVKNVGSVLVLHQSSHPSYTKLAQQEKNILCLALPLDSKALLEAIKKLPHKHVMLVNDDIEIMKPINCKHGIIDLERTRALGCYYHASPSFLEEHAIAYQHVRDELYAWKIYRDSNHAVQEHGCNMSLYRKNDIIELLTTQELTTIDNFTQSLPRRSHNLHAVGLCYNDACAISSTPETKPCDPREQDYYIAEFDKAMYATERHKNIYHEILSIKKEAAFIDLLRKNYTAFFDELPFSALPKIPKIIHHIWLGGPLPEQYKLWRKKWQDMHPDWVCLLWTDKEVAHLKLENQTYYDETTSFAEKANLLRYELLYQFGGLYVDTDCECFKPFDLLHHCCDFYAGCEYPQKSWSGSKIMIGNSIMASRPHHPLLKTLIDTVEETWHEELQVARSGTRYATNIIKKALPNASDVIMIFPANMFYPWASHKDPLVEPVTNQETFVQPETWSLHYWHFTWKPTSAKKKQPNYEPKQLKHDVKNIIKTNENPKKKRLLKRRTQG